MTRKWVKLWCTFDEDNLTLDEIGAWHVLLKLAGKSELDGTVCIDGRLPYTHQQLTNYLNCTPHVVKQVLKKLAEKDRIEVLPNGLLKLKNWEKYQSEYDRIKECPSKKGTQEGTPKGTPKGTPLDIDIDIEEEVEEDIDKEVSSSSPLSEKEKAFFAVYENQFGTVPSILVPELRLAANSYPLDWVKDAIISMLEGVKEGRVNNPSWRYIKSILRNWAIEGRHVTKSRKAQPSDDDPGEYQRRYGHLVK